MVADSFGRTNAVPILEDLEEPDLGGNEVAPPAYGEFHDQLQLSQGGIEAGAAVTDDGRVTININQKDRRLSQLLAPTLSRQLLAQAQAPRESLPPPYIPPSLGGLPGQTPPPKLNVVIQIVGSRGDVQPFIALGQVLRDTYGHRVRLATHPTFQKFVEDSGLEFFSIGGDPAELMAFMVKNPGLMPGFDALKSGEITKRRQGIQTMLMGCWRSCIEAGNGLGPPVRQQPREETVDERYILPGDPRDRPFVADAIIANPPSFAHIHLAEKLGIPLHMMFTYEYFPTAREEFTNNMPWSPTRAFPHPLASIESTNTTPVEANIVSYALVDMLTWQGLGDVINRFRTRVLDLEPMSLIWAPGILSRLRIPTTYCWSPALIPKPADWGPEVSVAGFYFLNLASSYTPDPDLAAFLEAGPPPVYIGFGSIVVDNPNLLTRTIFDAISMSGVRALVSKGWGGLGADAVGIPENVFMLGNCPHDWLFQRVSAVVHHGGAGTSAAGIKAGRPTVIVPFFGDQPFWGAMIAKAGAGPAPIPYKNLTAETLAKAIAEALKPETKARAEQLGAMIREEQGNDVGGKTFHQFLDTDNMRCSLAPSRVAVWRVRRTKTRLSALAAAVLVHEGILQYSDMKLYRPTEYNTAEQPWDPISAVTSAFVGDIGTMAMAVADFPRDLFDKRSKGKESPPHEATSPADTQTITQETSGSTTTAPSQVMSHSGTASTAASQTTAGHSSHRSLLRDACSSRRADSSSPSRRATVNNEVSSNVPNSINLDSAIEASKNINTLVSTGVKMPMNFCMGLARGFRNAPKLYNDDTVRPAEKVTGFASGLKVAGKEFGFGLYDGLSGLVTQPLRGAEKEGGRGLLKGVGKGIGGLVLKPAAAFWSLPAYAMQGVHAEVRNLFARSSNNYILTSRVQQGREDLAAATEEEQRDIIMRWHTRGEDLKGFYQLKQKEKSSTGSLSADGDGRSSNTSLPTPTSPGRMGWLHARAASYDERIRGHRRGQSSQQLGQPGHGSHEGSGNLSSADDEEFERAIRASVQQTSRGDRDEDARIEAAIRASVKEMRRIAAEQSREWNGPGEYPPEKIPITTEESLPGDDEIRNVTDEEYQALVEEAVRLSLQEQQQQQQQQQQQPGGEDDDLTKALEISRAETFGPGAANPVGPGDDEELKRVLEESERAHKEELLKQKTEEEIVLEYVKKQSLAEEEYRRSKRKGKAVAEAEDDEDLKRALEESLRASGKRGVYELDAGPS